MVLSGRRSRRFGTQAWIMVAIVVTLLVVLVDASIKSRSDGPVKTLSSQAWVDQVMPILGQTITQGDEINLLRTEPVTSSATGILPGLQGVVTNAGLALKAAQSLKAPASIEGPSFVLVTCLQTRLQGAQTLAAAMTTALTTKAADPFDQFAQAASDFQTSDTLYALFLQHMPAVGVRLPNSVWLSNPTIFTPASLNLYLPTLRNARSPLPVHQLEVETVSTLPPALSIEVTGGTQIQILPQSATITVMVTVGNLGNQTENGVIATASLNPSSPGYLASNNHEIPSLAQGQSDNFPIGPLESPLDQKVTLTVTVSPPSGQVGLSGTTKTIVFEMPSPNAPPSTTTTTVATPSTTVAGGASGTTGTSGTTTTTSG